MDQVSLAVGTKRKDELMASLDSCLLLLDGIPRVCQILDRSITNLSVTLEV